MEGKNQIEKIKAVINNYDDINKLHLGSMRFGSNLMKCAHNAEQQCIVNNFQNGINEDMRKLESYTVNLIKNIVINNEKQNENEKNSLEKFDQHKQ